MITIILYLEEHIILAYLYRDDKVAFELKVTDLAL